MTNSKDNTMLNIESDQQLNQNIRIKEENHLIDENELKSKFGEGWQKSLTHSSNTNSKYNYLVNKNFENYAQNTEFALSIVDNYLTNCTYIVKDNLNSVSRYSNKISSARNNHNLNEATQKFYSDIVRSVEQAYLVQTQIMLDWCNCVIVPSIKQVAAIRDKISHNF